MQQASLLSTRDFYSPTRFNQDTKNQLWMSIIADVHDSTCDCPTPFAHLLSSIFPPGHQDRDRTINEILARDYKERCHSGGLADEDPGSAATRDIKQEDTGEDLDPRDIDILLGAAAAAAEEEDTRNTPQKEQMHKGTQAPPNTPRKDPEMSPLTLRRRYLPRRRREPQTVHPQAAAATAAPQKKPPPALLRAEKQAKIFTTTDRNFRVKPFDPGCDWETEQECAKAFCRPPRKYKNDPPYYPWLPPTPIVNFHLNYKF
ncbi:hypothetical protein [Torque teno midi virus 5]|uniref:Hepatitis TT virus Orf2/Gyrovirus Vp2 N-terminal domain-containing protein n=2 Tax=Torque teno midi virus 5 TaxID=2065046 RepID=A7VLV3_9VIRU|nr:hypothetical protein [Torque teno midi virus 5]BAF76074.1 hypothetical protein [Torque teno midi virus 5]